jgi:TRAP-type mannitol/chloroaromatic compound transport system permease large subunit
MFFVLMFIMFVGYPVAFVLGGDRHLLRRARHRPRTFQPGAVREPLPRIWGQAVQNQVLVACRCSSSWAPCSNAAAWPRTC